MNTPAGLKGQKQFSPGAAMHSHSVRPSVGSVSWRVPADHRRGATSYCTRRRDGLKAGRPSGFTLVEMLVAIALVVLMMSMFAEIFQLATNAMGKQKALAELDQRARMVDTVIRADLGCRTFRELSPFAGNENTSVGARLDQRRGYFYISENLSTNDLDDVLKFTIDKRLGAHPDGQPLFARTIQIPDSTGKPTNADQPEYDDGQIVADNTGTSFMAEVSYFVRSGILYRRVLLIRQPLLPQSDGQPHIDSPPYYTPPAGTTMKFASPSPSQWQAAAGTSNFWTDFDYSAYLQTGTNILTFNTADDLENNGISGIAHPSQRFGHNRSTGQPREYISGGAVFIGCFTKAECSDLSFGYPGTVARGAGNPFDPATPLTDNITGTLAGVTPAIPTGLPPADGVVDQYASGTRVSEDILLANVHGFDIKVWDPGASVGPDGSPGFAVNTADTVGKVVGYANDNQNFDTATPPNPIINEIWEQGWPGSDDGMFVDLGTGNGFYSAANKMNSQYGDPTAAAANRNIFDTWHPHIDFFNNATGVATPDGIPDPPPYRPMGFGPDGKPGKANWNDDFATGNMIMDYDPASTPAGKPDGGKLGASASGEVGYPGSDDAPIPMRAIQIRVRYLDVSSNQMREMTIVVPLTD